MSEVNAIAKRCLRASNRQQAKNTRQSNKSLFRKKKKKGGGVDESLLLANRFSGQLLRMFTVVQRR